MAATNGLMPMVAYAAYSPIYYTTVDTLPAAQFFFGASLNVLIIIIFIIVQLRNTPSGKSIEVGQSSDRSLFKVFKNRSAITLKSMEITLTQSKRQFETSLSKDNQNRTDKLHGVEELPSNVKITSRLPVERTYIPVAAGDGGERRKDDADKNYKSIFSVHEADGRSVTKSVASKSIPPEASRDGNHEKESCSESACEERPPCFRTKDWRAGCYNNEMSDAEITASESLANPGTKGKEK
nr:uncharacterized protein LOC113807584 [Penaeus vannamei]